MSRHDDMHAHLDATGRDPRDGFDALMERMKRMTQQEVAELQLQADSAELGHAAYALGLTMRERGENYQAKYWLQMAARYCVAGAARALETMESPDMGSATALESHQVEEAVLCSAASTGAARAAASTGRSIGGVVLPASHESLARGVPASMPGTIFALAFTGGVTVGPADGRRILFGRDRAAVHICLGEDDSRVGRHQGTLTHDAGQWRVHNAGPLPIRIAGRRWLFPDEEPVPLNTGFTQLFVETSRDRRQHLLEVFVTGQGGERPVPRHSEVTRQPDRWWLTPTERLVLVVLGQRYLRHDPRPRPLSRAETAAQLAELQPEAGWTANRVEYLVQKVRVRLSRERVPGLTREEVGEPVGNRLNHNLIRELLMSTTLVPRDLALIGAT